MANSNPPSPSTERRSGFCSETKIFHSLRPAITLPNPTLPCSFSSYIFSLLHSSSPGLPPENPALIESDTGLHLSFPDLIARTKTLASSLKNLIAKGDVAFILSPTSIEIPVLYLSLLSLGVVVSPANPLSTPAEISRQATLSRPKIAFATSATAQKISSLGIPIVLFDSPDFESMMTSSADGREEPAAIVYQSDPAAILYSSGTTGNVKGVVLTHRNLAALVGGIHSLRQDRPIPLSTLLTVPLFHVYGFFYCFKAVAMGETVVLMKRFEMGKAMRAVEEYKVAFLTVAPPVVVEMVKGEWSKRCDLSSLEAIGSGGAPLGKETIEAFAAKFPNVHLGQGYGLTECTGAAFRTVGPEESKRYGSSGRLQPNIEAKIVDPLTGEAFPPCNRGELWIRGPTIMQGYIGDEAATAETLDSEGWLKTGDLCYIDNDGFIYIVDRLKELIKYKGFQVAPAELEHLLRSHQDIADAAVIPYPDEKAGQIPMAFVVRLPHSTINQEQVMEFVAKQVSSYKKVRRVAFISSIPKNPAGKILRKDLIKLVLSDASSKL